MTRLRRIAPALALLGLLTACAGSPDDTSSDSDTGIEQPADDTDTGYTDDDGTSPDALDTATAIENTWNQKTPAERDTMCQSIDQFGTDWAAVSMKAGAEKSNPDTADDLDWDEAALIIEQKCENR
ncbi:hypothetical protein ACFQ9Z_36940 [Streptomyces sp. NPDC056580]|uniref:hypothetical protein n=1 Tax=Streptomyces sp. NPDC056580 TaxID=3345872 RepID=UPI00368489DE